MLVFQQAVLVRPLSCNMQTWLKQLLDITPSLNHPHLRTACRWIPLWRYLCVTGVPSAPRPSGTTRTRSSTRCSDSLWMIRSIRASPPWSRMMTCTPSPRCGHVHQAGCRSGSCMHGRYCAISSPEDLVLQKVSIFVVDEPEQQRLPPWSRLMIRMLSSRCRTQHDMHASSDM